MSAQSLFSDPAMLIRNFEPATLQRAAGCVHAGKVLSVDLDAERALVSGRVLGSGRRAYQTIARLSLDRGGAVQVKAQCSCPVAVNCKHAAALLIVAARDAALEPSALPGHQGSRDGARLSVEVEGWLARCERVASGQVGADPNSLIYVLRPEERRGLRRLAIAAFKVRRLKSGGRGKPQPYRIDSQSNAAFITPEDRRIRALAQAGSIAGVGGHLILDELTATDLVVAMVVSGRCHWVYPEGPALHREAALAASLQWQLGEDGRQRVVLQCDRSGLELLPLVPPWYLDPTTGACGPVASGLGDQEAGLLAAAPAVTPEAADTLGQMAEVRLKGLDLPLPPRPTRRRLARVQPMPRLRLYSEEATGAGYWAAADDPLWYHYAVLDFVYGDLVVDPRDPRSVYQQVVDGELMEGERDRERESEAIDVLIEVGFDPVDAIGERHGPWFDLADDMDWIAFMRDSAPAMVSGGWRIEPIEGFEFQIIDTDDWTLDIAEGEGGRWLDLALGVEVNGEPIDLLPVLLDLARHARGDLSLEALTEAGDGADLPVRLPDGRLILMPVVRLRPMLSTLIELYDPQPRLTKDNRLRLSSVQAGQLAALEQADPGLQWRGGEAARALGRRLHDFEGIAEVPPPDGLQAELRPYQRKGLDWLQFLRDYQLGGVLADDMGLGKTVQALAHLLVEKAAGRTDRPSLMVAPTSLMFNWRREAARFAPDLRVLLLHGPARKQAFDKIPDNDLVLTTYPLLPRDLGALTAHEYHLLILDEAQAIKNPKSKVAQAVRGLKARHRIALTGTPLENHLGELWSLFDFLMPEMLGDQRRFARLFRTPIERQGDPVRQEELRRRVAPFLLRRTKEVVAAELPPKTEIMREVALAQDQRDLYETMRLGVHERVRKEVERKGLAKSGIVILDALLKLRQVCCDPRLVSLDSARKVKGSAKLDLLMSLLPELLEEGRRVLLFSQFTGMLALIEEALGAQGLREGEGFVKLTGRTRKRDEPVDRFQSGQVPLFLISLKAGGSGLNLTAADTVIHYDPWWNPAAERQATDRAHRIGQDKPVFVYKLLTEGTVEQRVAEMQARKQALADAMLAGGGAAAGALSSDDLDLLFAPLGD